MLDEAEYQQVQQVHTRCVEAVKSYRRVRNSTLKETPLDEIYRPVRQLIEQLTGTAEFEIDEVLRRHRLSRWAKG